MCDAAPTSTSEGATSPTEQVTEPTPPRDEPRSATVTSPEEPTVEQAAVNPTQSSLASSLKRPRSEPVTQFLNPTSLSSSSQSSTPAGPDAPPPPPPAADVAVSAVPPKQVRVESSNSAGGSLPTTPHSPYANLPRKMPRKTPVSTPASSLGTPPLVVSPNALTSPASLTSTPPTVTAAAAAKRTSLHQRWAGLLHSVLMKERQPHEAETVRALSLRIIEALPGDLEQTKDSFQTLLFNMKDAKNGELRRKVVEGELLVERLVAMDDRELANPDLRKQIEEKMEDRAKDTNLSELSKAMRTSNSTLFKCKVCGARDTSWFQRQTRSGDEPMTVIITCNRCNTQWRQY